MTYMASGSKHMSEQCVQRADCSPIDHSASFPDNIAGIAITYCFLARSGLWASLRQPKSLATLTESVC